jgi:ketosteroid isomerase-like protein
MTITTREAFQAGTDRFNEHDIDGFAEVLADDVVFQGPGGVGGSGKAACVEFYRSWFDAFSDAHVAVDGLHCVDDVVVEEGTFTGTHDGIWRSPGGDIPPTDRSVSVPYIQVLQFSDGKHASFNLMFDRLLMLEQLGLVPAPSTIG